MPPTGDRRDRLRALRDAIDGAPAPGEAPDVPQAEPVAAEPVEVTRAPELCPECGQALPDDGGKCLYCVPRPKLAKVAPPVAKAQKPGPPDDPERETESDEPLTRRPPVFPPSFPDDTLRRRRAALIIAGIVFLGLVVSLKARAHLRAGRSAGSAPAGMSSTPVPMAPPVASVPPTRGGSSGRTIYRPPVVPPSVQVATPRAATPRTCYSCNGTGWDPCNRCNGAGRCTSCNGAGADYGRCYRCRRTGTVACPGCGGRGTVGTRYSPGVVVVNPACSQCAGRGSVVCPACGGRGTMASRCSSCSGTGRCRLCQGAGGRPCYCQTQRAR